MENWTEVMYPYREIYGNIAVVFFVAVILFITFFALNLVLAVIYETMNTSNYIHSLETLQKEQKVRCVVDQLAGVPILWPNFYLL